MDSFDVFEVLEVVVVLVRVKNGVNFFYFLLIVFFEVLLSLEIFV